MKKLLFIACILFASVFCADAQRNDYISIGDTVTYGVKLSSPSGLKRYHEIINKEKGGKFIIYTPDEVFEFSVDRNIFVSMLSPIEGEENRVFLRRLINRDSIAVYMYENRDGRYFFLDSQDHHLIEITDQDDLYYDYLSTIYGSGSKNLLDRYRLKLNPRSILFAEKLARTKNYNLLTRLRYGAWVGMGQGKLTNKTLHITYDNIDTYLFVGGFINIPIYRQLTLQTELFYMHEAYSMNRTNSFDILDRAYNRRSLVMPIMPRFSFNRVRGKFIPYFQAGPTVHFALKKSEETQLVQIEDNNVTITQRPSVEKKNYFYLDLNVGVGVEYRFTNRNSIFLDLRYMRTLMEETRNLLYFTISINI